MQAKQSRAGELIPGTINRQAQRPALYAASERAPWGGDYSSKKSNNNSHRRWEPALTALTLRERIGNALFYVDTWDAGKAADIIFSAAFVCYARSSYLSSSSARAGP
jgi:hypothetical protein